MRIRHEFSAFVCAVAIGSAAGFHAFTSPRTHSTRLNVQTADCSAPEMDPAEFEKALVAMTSFSNRYVKLSDTK